MNHEPYFREGTGNHAVLLIHGIAGSPGHFRDLIPVIPDSFYVYNILLDGHNGAPKDFGRSSMARWKTQVDNTLQALFSHHDKVVIVAHSMGTLFAIQAAIRHPDRIPALFLLSVPSRPWVRLSTMVTTLQVVFGKIDSPKARAMFEETAITMTPKLWQYLGWIPRMLELLIECRRVRKRIPLLAVPTQAFQSQVDELVSIRSCKDLRNPCIQTTILPGSGHFAYGPEDTALLQRRLLDTLEKI